MIGRKIINCIQTVVGSDHGRPVELITKTFTIVGSRQPLKPSELILAPEGRRQDKLLKIFTNDTLYFYGDPSRNPDKVLADGPDTDPYEVIAEDDWSNGIRSYKMYIIAKQNVVE
jgi:hypothetical protein